MEHGVKQLVICLVLAGLLQCPAMGIAVCLAAPDQADAETKQENTPTNTKQVRKDDPANDPKGEPGEEPAEEAEGKPTEEAEGKPSEEAEGKPTEEPEGTVPATQSKWKSKALKVGLFVVATGLIFFLLWFGISLAVSRWGTKKPARVQEVELSSPEVLPVEDVPKEEVDLVDPIGPDSPVFKGQRSAQHYLAYNFSVEQLQRFLVDLEESGAGKPGSPYLTWENESIAQYIKDVQGEIVTRGA